MDGSKKNASTAVEIKRAPLVVKLWAKTSGRTKAILFSAILVIIAGFVVMTVLNKPDNSKYYAEAAAVMNPSKAEQLGFVVDSIKQLPDYQKDPNLLFPIIMYYNNVTDATNASLYYSFFKKAYNQKEGLDPVYSIYGKTDKDVALTIKLLNERVKSLEGGARYYD